MAEEEKEKATDLFPAEVGVPSLPGPSGSHRCLPTPDLGCLSLATPDNPAGPSEVVSLDTGDWTSCGTQLAMCRALGAAVTKTRQGCGCREEAEAMESHVACLARAGECCAEVLWSLGSWLSHLLWRVRSRGSRQALLVAQLRPCGDAGQRCWSRARLQDLQAWGAGEKVTGSSAVGSVRAGYPSSPLFSGVWSG